VSEHVKWDPFSHVVTNRCYIPSQVLSAMINLVNAFSFAERFEVLTVVLLKIQVY
jgi:hypothetical protein